MRHARSPRYLPILSLLALPACLAVPTFAKWHLEELPHDTGPWAVGTKAEIIFSFTKGCAAEYAVVGGFAGCFDSPQSDAAITVTSAVVSDPSVFAARATGRKVMVEALRDGEATLEVKGKNRHGDVRSASIKLAAATATEVRAELWPGENRAKFGCVAGRRPTGLWFYVGENFRLTYRMYGGGRVVDGTPLTVSAKGTPGFREVSSRVGRVPGDFAVNVDATYVMSEPGTFAVSAAGFPEFSLTGGGYTCQTLTGVGFTAVKRDPFQASFDLAQLVGADAVCSGELRCPITLTVNTPAVCALSGKGDGARVKTSGGPLSVQRRAAGTCELSAALEGTPHTASAKFVFE